MLQGFGFISVQCGATDVYFSFGALCEQYLPRKGDRVRLTAIEVNGKGSKWRAIRVEPAREMDRLMCLNR